MSSRPLGAEQTFEAKAAMGGVHDARVGQGDDSLEGRIDAELLHTEGVLGLIIGVATITLTMVVAHRARAGRWAGDEPEPARLHSPVAEDRRSTASRLRLT